VNFFPCKNCTLFYIIIHYSLKKRNNIHTKTNSLLLSIPFTACATSGNCNGHCAACPGCSGATPRPPKSPPMKYKLVPVCEGNESVS